MKSSSSVGPFKPALSELWLSPIGTPWFVVSGVSGIAAMMIWLGPETRGRVFK